MRLLFLKENLQTKQNHGIYLNRKSTKLYDAKTTYIHCNFGVNPLLSLKQMFLHYKEAKDKFLLQDPGQVIGKIDKLLQSMRKQYSKL